MNTRLSLEIVIKNNYHKTHFKIIQWQRMLEISEQHKYKKKRNNHALGENGKLFNCLLFSI